MRIEFSSINYVFGPQMAMVYMGYVAALIEALCSVNCADPYIGVLAWFAAVVFFTIGNLTLFSVYREAVKFGYIGSRS